jgi:hypothetical protein
MRKTLKKHLDAIKSGSVTKTNIIGLRKAFNTNARFTRRIECGRTSPHVAPDDIAEIRRAITMHEPRVSRDLDASGPQIIGDYF